MTLEVIDNLQRLVEIEPEWSSFARTIRGVTPFQLPRWLLTWWAHFGNGQLHVLVFRENDALVGILPSFRHQWNGLRQITLIGSGISDYLDPALEPEHCAAILDHLRNHLDANLDWDVCDWQDLSSNTPLSALSGKFEVTTTPDISCSEIRLTGTFEEFRNARPKDLKRNLRRYRKKALRFFTLHFEERTVALIVAFPYGKTMFGYLSAFDPEYEALGFGRTLLFESLRYCYENGYEAWNFLRGDEPYKFWWGAQTIPKCRVRIVRTQL